MNVVRIFIFHLCLIALSPLVAQSFHSTPTAIDAELECQLPAEMQEIYCEDEAVLQRLLEVICGPNGLWAADFRVRVVVNKDGTPLDNALTCERNGKIWIGWALLQKVSDDALAVLLFHEVGHRYPRAVENAAWLTPQERAVLDDLNSSQRSEIQADLAAYGFLLKAGYAPERIRRAFWEIKKVLKSGPHQFHSLTHPSMEQREIILNGFLSRN
ncbi:hypothetical protein QWY85_17205 [Neolewinella lacunae]|uniref:Peptidase M48 domain-containing protein n=1 Tax=Neolewinella lacunae TaxID=1517758 RepID=A0A923PND3_9BACT|nr:hypothetical protein [Neolewinella lacunae]MBC6995901.1 hypothetical protein [Neolewinella lacunae]MDN3636407.1 hypothetical protein [Neolewinella lacunae]